MAHSSLLGLLIKSNQNKKNGIKHKNEKEKLPEPGIDPGSLEPQSNILPLNYSGSLHIFFFFLMLNESYYSIFSLGA